MNAPQLTFRQAVTPYAVIPTIIYTQTTPYGNTLPVLSGQDSNHLFFRIYNNYALASSIANAINVYITTFDGVGSGSHTTNNAVTSQHWVHVYQNGFGENSTPPGLYTFYGGSDTAVGGLGYEYLLDMSSDGFVQGNQIRAWTNQNGCGFAEIQSYCRVPSGAVAGNQTFAISVIYEWAT